MHPKLFLKQISLVVILFLFGSKVAAQDTVGLFRTDNYSTIDYYTELSFGLVKPLYRDFATSPLFYSGVGINLNFARLRRSDARERIFDVGLGFNVLSAKVPSSNFIQAGASGMFGHMDLYYHELWKIKQLSDEKYNLKVGGALLVTQNVRQIGRAHV